MSEQEQSTTDVVEPKNLGGKPRIISSPEEFEKRVLAYRARCQANEEPMTFTGLVLALGLAFRTSLHEYQKRPEFRQVCAWAKTLVEHEYEKRLYSQAPAGAIFALKNYGWTDRQDVAHSGNIQHDIRAVRERVESRLEGIAERLLESGGPPTDTES